MQTEILSIENISQELLQSYFEQAFFNTSLDDKGSLFVQDRFRVYLDIAQKKNSVAFSVYFKISQDSTNEQKLELVNTINNDLMQVKAILGPTMITIQYDFWLEGGSTVKNLILAYRHFVAQTVASVSKDKNRVLL
ncbi:MAG: hypothetical protein H6755_04210 [Candidatus Omnitrophica bacterium]|nr:hypothetical protein [Candidatus Omnitrophota bacterium]MCB9747594.1 hypothetical protein [Candidatus Omnitrophota bacterium]